MSRTHPSPVSSRLSQTCSSLAGSEQWERPSVFCCPTCCWEFCAIAPCVSSSGGAIPGRTSARRLSVRWLPSCPRSSAARSLVELPAKSPAALFSLAFSSSYGVDTAREPNRVPVRSRCRPYRTEGGMSHHRRQSRRVRGTVRHFDDGTLAQNIAGVRIYSSAHSNRQRRADVGGLPRFLVPLDEDCLESCCATS